MEDRFQNLETQVAKIRDDNQKPKDDNQSIKVQVEEIKEDNRKLGDLRNVYLTVRERAYLTFLQDHCAGYKETHKDQIKTVNQSVVHGGDALADASMFLERRPVDAQEEEQRLFRRIYGLHAEKIKELGKFYLPHSIVLLLLTQKPRPRWIQNNHSSLGRRWPRPSPRHHGPEDRPGENIQQNRGAGAGGKSQGG